MSPASTSKTHRGVVVPMVTPITSTGELDEPAVRRVADHLCRGGVHGLFVLGTTGEAPFISQPVRDRLVELTLEQVNGRALVYAGISADSSADSVAAGKRYLHHGVDAVVAHVPGCLEARPGAALRYFSGLAERLEGNLILYNMPLTTNVSLPIALCKSTAGLPRVIGIKDSENNAARMMELLRELGGRKDFSVFIGTGPLMGEGLLHGADGIVPSVGNLVPALCLELYETARRGEAAAARRIHEQLMQVSGIYQNGRELTHSLAALKSAMACLGLCQPYMFPPARPVDANERAQLRADLAGLGFALADTNGTELQKADWTHDGRPSGGRAGALPACPG